MSPVFTALPEDLVYVVLGFWLRPALLPFVVPDLTPRALAGLLRDIPRDAVAELVAAVARNYAACKRPLRRATAVELARRLAAGGAPPPTRGPLAQWWVQTRCAPGETLELCRALALADDLAWAAILQPRVDAARLGELLEALGDCGLVVRLPMLRCAAFRVGLGGPDALGKLRALLRRRGRLPPADLSTLFRDAWSSLSAANGVVPGVSLDSLLGVLIRSGYDYPAEDQTFASLDELGEVGLGTSFGVPRGWRRTQLLNARLGMILRAEAEVSPAQREQLLQLAEMLAGFPGS